MCPTTCSAHPARADSTSSITTRPRKRRTPPPRRGSHRVKVEASVIMAGAPLPSPYAPAAPADPEAQAESSQLVVRASARSDSPHSDARPAKPAASPPPPPDNPPHGNSHSPHPQPPHWQTPVCPMPSAPSVAPARPPVFFCSCFDFRRSSSSSVSSLLVVPQSPCGAGL